MRIAIQEDLLPGRTPREKFEQAAALGFDGVELWADDLDAKMLEIATAVAETGVVVSAINHGRRDGLLHPEPQVRDQAVKDLRDSIMAATDLGASGVLFVPQFGAPTLPDLMPYLSPEGLEVELLIAHLRVLEDYAAAMGVELFIQAVCREQSHFLNRVAHAAALAHKRDHPAVKIAVSTYDMNVEEDDPAALSDAAGVLAYVHLADSNHCLPGQGDIEFAAVATALRAIRFDGWCALACGELSVNDAEALPACLSHLRAVGIVA